MMRFPGKNIVAQIIALVLAMVLWIYVTYEQNPAVEDILAIVLEVRNVTSPLVGVDYPDTVKVKVRGSRSVIASLRNEDIKAYIDLKGMQEGHHSAKVYVQIPVNLELVEVSPDKVPIRLENVISRTVPVEIRLQGITPVGFAAGKITAGLEQVTVQGPKSYVETVDKVLLQVDLADKKADFVLGVRPVPVNAAGREVEGVAVSPEKIDVSASIVRGLNQKTVEVRAAPFGSLPTGVVLKGLAVKPAKIEISGDSQVLDKITVLYTEPVNLATITKDTAKEVKIQVEDGVLFSQSTVVLEISVGSFNHKGE